MVSVVEEKTLQRGSEQLRVLWACWRLALFGGDMVKNKSLKDHGVCRNARMYYRSTPPSFIFSSASICTLLTHHVGSLAWRWATTNVFVRSKTNCQVITFLPCNKPSTCYVILRWKTTNYTKPAGLLANIDSPIAYWLRMMVSSSKGQCI